MRPILTASIVIALLSPAAALAWGKHMYPSHGSTDSVTFDSTTSPNGGGGTQSGPQPVAGAFKSVDGLDAGVEAEQRDEATRTSTDILFTLDRSGP